MAEARKRQSGSECPAMGPHRYGFKLTPRCSTYKLRVEGVHID